MSGTYFDQFYDSQSQDAEKLERSRFLGPKVKIIFALSILQIICNVLSNERVVMISLELYFVGLIAGVIVGIIYGAILISMSKVSDRFKIAGVCNILSPIIAFVAGLIGGAALVIGSITLLIIPFVAMYQEIYGYSDTLSGINNALSMKWQGIWKSMITWLIVMIVSLIVMIFIQIIGMIGIIVSAIAIIVVSITRLVCIADTANVFNNYVAYHNK